MKTLAYIYFVGSVISLLLYWAWYSIEYAKLLSEYKEKLKFAANKKEVKRPSFFTGFVSEWTFFGSFVFFAISYFGILVFIIWSDKI